MEKSLKNFPTRKKELQLNIESKFYKVGVGAWFGKYAAYK